MELEGVITLAPPDTPIGEFELNGRSVLTSGQTTFTSGTIADIAINIRVTARGTVDNNGTLAADNVEFH